MITSRSIVGVVCILDLFHVLERLWQAAHCFHPEGSEEARAFVTDRLLRLLRGEVGYVIGGLKQMATKHKLKGSRARQLSAVIGYLERNRRFMHYDQYLASGYPIGSGVAEGACRHLVKDRMELTGMRWCIPGAQAMLDLRAVYINGDWDRCRRCVAVFLNVKERLLLWDVQALHSGLYDTKVALVQAEHAEIIHLIAGGVYGLFHNLGEVLYRQLKDLPAAEFYVVEPVLYAL